MKIYISTPMTGRTYQEIHDYYDKTAMTLKSYNHHVMSPMTGRPNLQTEVMEACGNDRDITTNHAIVERDRWMLSKSDIVYTNLIGCTRISIGCCMELAWAHDRGIHSIVVMEPNNMHDHCYIRETADIIFHSEAEALAYFKNLID